ncbi:LysR family transcriptional regulator [Actinomadura roseirufa]|uniref:LysR family transcriptional regulator n=1 Tax=Actinomadura roseirufa TaxID=2094049 RepID=UPI001041B64D|nr:LysR family transcriptional regulator [Actinomadura roseirufa]
MELRQLRYFVAVSEELKFGRAAAREHIVQSALSQQIQRLEREVDVRLLDRTTHYVALTPAGAAFLVEARRILAHVERAAQVARTAQGTSPALRVGIVDASYDSMPQILHEAQALHPDLVIHHCVPSSCISALPGTIWRPLTQPASSYPWSILWRAADDSDHVRAIVTCARNLSERLGWLTSAHQTTG